MKHTEQELRERYDTLNALFDAGADAVSPEFTRGKMAGIRQTLGWILGDNCMDPLKVIILPTEIWDRAKEII